MGESIKQPDNSSSGPAGFISFFTGQGNMEAVLPGQIQLFPQPGKVETATMAKPAQARNVFQAEMGRGNAGLVVIHLVKSAHLENH